MPLSSDSKIVASSCTKLAEIIVGMIVQKKTNIDDLRVKLRPVS